MYVNRFHNITRLNTYADRMMTLKLFQINYSEDNVWNIENPNENNEKFHKSFDLEK